MRKPNIPNGDFIKAFNGSETNKETADKLDVSMVYVRNTASRLRKAGVSLKKRHMGRKVMPKKAKTVKAIEKATVVVEAAISTENGHDKPLENTPA